MDTMQFRKRLWAAMQQSDDLCDSLAEAMQGPAGARWGHQEREEALFLCVPWLFESEHTDENLGVLLKAGQWAVDRMAGINDGLSPMGAAAEADQAAYYRAHA